MGKRMRNIWLSLIFSVFGAFLLRGDEACAGLLLAEGDSGDGGGTYINLIVREVKVAPLRAHVGDAIRIEMVVENQGDLGNDTIPAEIKANGKVVAGRLFTYGFGGEGDRIQRLTFTWDTGGASPGEYRIRGEVFAWIDASPFDNHLEVPEALKLLPAGAAFPAGEEEGGTGMVRDPRYKPAALAPGSASFSAGGI